MKKNSNALSLRLFIDLYRANTTLQRKLSNNLSSSGITLSQFAVLEALYNKGELCVGDIKDTILTTNGNITVVIANLEKEGYIIREKDKKDRRKFIIIITDKGKKLVEKLFPLQESTIIDTFKHIDDELKEQMIKELNAIWYKEKP
ncbi:MarR family winged helix-turn-helix transcriptional regulator [Miniphocaeibacter halophilus]|uniref:MarR family transcriptional regulator n=1 Tax=Miniphocaeibacter halophilus TaxID=2931922 RepID=A0AC61MU75_9FIRM|nr:MarR family transcriptional regulator [Miniphocaeibacter halophilus]QQK07891.1 MarR family transcriptional regulator [Miniphocaeibacter halophilus]